MKLLRQFNSLISRKMIVAWALIIFFFMGALPALVLQGGISAYGIDHSSKHYAYFFDSHPLVLIFALVVGMPCVWPLAAEIKSGYFRLLRMREEVRSLLWVRFAVNWVVLFVTFFSIGVLPLIFMAGDNNRSNPALLGLWSAQDIYNAEINYTTFSVFRRLGKFGFPLVFSTWLGLNAAIYGTICLSTLYLLKSRLVAVILPWFFMSTCRYLLAQVELDRFAPSNVFLFDEVRRPLYTVGIQLGIVSIAAGIMFCTCMVAAKRLATLQ